MSWLASLRRTVGRFIFLPALMLALVIPYTAAFAGQFVNGTYNSRNYKLFIPAGYQQGTALPLVVMLHGCTQDPTQFSTGTRMNTLADTENFFVLYPEQTAAANANKCWNWFEPSHQSRGSGEPALIAGMVNQVKGQYTIDNNRVYAHGLSAGAAMSVILGATYPDVFAAIGVASGLEYKAATSMTGGFTAMTQGGPNPDTQGTAAKNAMGSYARAVPVILFHGKSDYTVYPLNGDQVIQQWAQTDDLASDGADNNNIDNTADQTVSGSVSGGYTYTKYIYKDTQSREWLHKYMIDSMGHAWSGGDTAGSYTDPKGPSATALSWAFFKANPKNGGGADTTPPVTAASPAGGTYSSAVTVTLSVNESATTYYTLDGSTPTTSSAQYSAPFAISASKTLKFFSRDTAGNSEAVKTEVYTIGGGSDTTPPVTTASPAGGTYSSAVTVTLNVNESATTYYTLDGSTPTTGSAQYSAPLAISASKTLKFFSRDTAGNSEAVKTEVYTIGGGTGGTFTSLAAEDGFVGALVADGLSTTVHKLGDKGMYNSDTYRTILSFDTASLPDTATISQVKLRIYRKTLTGSVGTIYVDIKSGVFGNAALEQSDFSAAASLAGSCTLTAPAADNTYSEVTLPAAALPYINKTGKTQIRLRTSTAANMAGDVLEIHGGDNATYAPQLIVTYN